MTSFTSKISKTVAKTFATAALLVSFSGSAFAAPILGELSYGGLFFPLDGPGGSTVTLGDADYLDFTFGIVGTASGDLAGVTSIDLASFAIDPFAAPSLVWTETGGGFSFELTTLTIVVQNDNFLTLKGTGLFKGAGYDDTDAVWSLTSQDPADPDPVLFFSASTEVSEPGMLTLLGFTLLGLGIIRKVKVKPTLS